MIASSVERIGVGKRVTPTMRNVTSLGGSFGVHSDSTLLNSPNRARAQPSSASSVPKAQNVSNCINGLNVINGHVPKKVDSKVIAEFFHKEPCLYGHETFKMAGTLYEALQHPPVDDPLALHKFEQTRKDSLPDVQFNSDNEKRLVLNLVFSTLKCK